jgi:hypothetical protein
MEGNMQDNAQNNWKQLLENADGLPAEVLIDKNATWEKLYTRLQNKPVRKHRTWYWAAACLLATSITTFVFIDNENHQPSVTVSSPTRQTPLIKKQPLHGEQKKSKVPIFASPEKSSNLIITQKNKAANKIEPASNHNLITDSTGAQTVTPIQSEAELHLDSPTKETIATIPPRKKIRVVHINDLGQPAEESTADNKPPGKYGFQLRILNAEYYNSSPAGTRNNGLILFKSQNVSN